MALGDGYLDTVRATEQALGASRLTAKQVAAIRDSFDSGTSCSQPEIGDDLAVQPPDLPDARARLSALDDALSSPLRAAAGVQGKLHSLALGSPYNREQPEPPGDVLNGAFQSLLAKLAAAACGGALAVVFLIFKWVAIAAVVLAILVLAYQLVRRYVRRGREPDRRPDEEERLRTAAERFAAADRLAAAGDLAAALRELAGAVATVLGGEAAWDLSPLTVREIYDAAGKLAELRPLLRGFEEAVYGHRPVTRATYDAAAAAAAAYRPRARKAA